MQSYSGMIHTVDEYMQQFSILSKTENSEVALQEFIDENLTPEIAFQIIQDQENDYQNRYFKIVNYDNENIMNLFLRAFFEIKFSEAYGDIIQSLIVLYQNDKTRNVAIKTMYELLQNPEFRDLFQADNQWSPFFMDGFYQQLQNFIKAQDIDPKTIQVLLDASQPKVLSQALIESELIKALNYKKPLSPEQQDIIAIQQFLANVASDSPIMKQMQKLENLLEIEAGPRFDPVSRKLSGYIEGEPYRHEKLLSNFIKKFAQAHQFTGYGVIKGVLMPESFYAFLSKGGLFKDSYFQGESHGDFTHDYQLCLIELWNSEDPDKPKLNCTLSHLLKWIGENQKTSEWVFTFEFELKSLYKPTDCDFRNVNTLHAYLNKPDCPFPVLHQLNKGRTAKGPKPFSQDPPEFKSF